MKEVNLIKKDDDREESDSFIDDMPQPKEEPQKNVAFTREGEDDDTEEITWYRVFM